MRGGRFCNRCHEDNEAKEFKILARDCVKWSIIKSEMNGGMDREPEAKGETRRVEQAG